MLRSVLFTALIAFSASAGAQGFDYSFFQVGYERVTLDDGSFDVDGDGDLDILLKPYNHNSPRVDILLNSTR